MQASIALITTLPSGDYTAFVSGKHTSAGVALVDVYAVKVARASSLRLLENHKQDACAT